MQVTTGGPLAPKIGDALVKQGVKMVSVYGGTEFGITSTISDGADERSPEDWNYMRFSKLTNIRWVPQGDGTFENQFLVYWDSFTSPLFAHYLAS